MLFWMLVKGLGKNKRCLDLDPKILKQPSPLLDTNGPFVLNISQVTAIAENRT